MAGIGESWGFSVGKACIDGNPQAEQIFNFSATVEPNRALHSQSIAAMPRPGKRKHTAQVIAFDKDSRVDYLTG